jgi:hypothetical protein
MIRRVTPQWHEITRQVGMFGSVYPAPLIIPLLCKPVYPRDAKVHRDDEQGFQEQ